MSWTENKKTIADIIADLGYTELKENISLDLESTSKHKHKHFTIIPSGAISDFITAIAYQDIATLKVAYICKNIDEVDKYYDEFKSIMTAINKHIGAITEDISFTRASDNINYWFASVSFTIGFSC